MHRFHGNHPARQAHAEASGQDKMHDLEQKPPRPPIVIAATYKYLSEGIRTLGRAYTTYDDRSPQ